MIKYPAKKMLWFILVISFLLKTALVLAHGTAYNYHSDDQEYIRSAQIWLETGVFTYNDPSRPTVFITPALPGFIALLMKVLGPGLVLEQTIRILQALMITLALGLLFVVGRRIFSERVGLWAAGLAAFYPPLWLVSSFIFTEAMFTLAVMLLVYVALRAQEEPKLKWALAFGAVWALTVYIRPTIALWPGIFILMLIYWRLISWQALLRSGLTAALIFILCLLPWWVRNYEVSGGHFIPLTKSGGNPLLLGTYPFTVPALFLEEQRTWHPTNNLWINDELDTKHAIQRIKAGFHDSFWTYLSWYTVGKFALFWGDVFYWLPIPGIPLAVAILYHYALLIPGFIGIYAFWREWRGRDHNPKGTQVKSYHGAMLIISLLAYMTLLHMVYLGHSRYSVPLMPFIALFAAYYGIKKFNREHK
jgi:4-amino-4-deoxy-L-arabinose transferase-like glycosyltransferase